MPEERDPPGSERRRGEAATAAGELVLGRIQAGRREGRRDAEGRDLEEEEEGVDGVAQVDRTVVVGVGSLLAGQLELAPVEPAQGGDGVRDVHAAVGVRIAPE